LVRWRLGLRNLARSLHDQGIIEDDSMQALGAFVAGAEGLAVDGPGPALRPAQPRNEFGEGPLGSPPSTF
jgi:hypothetical protein